MANLHVRVDGKLKKQVQKTLEEIGLDMSSAINVYFRQIALSGSIPFEIRTVNGFTLRQERQMKREMNWALKHGKRFNSAEELLRDILGDKDYDEWMAESVSGARNKAVSTRRQKASTVRLRSTKATRHDQSPRKRRSTPR